MWLLFPCCCRIFYLYSRVKINLDYERIAIGIFSFFKIFFGDGFLVVRLNRFLCFRFGFASSVRYCVHYNVMFFFKELKIVAVGEREDDRHVFSLIRSFLRPQRAFLRRAQDSCPQSKQTRFKTFIFTTPPLEAGTKIGNTCGARFGRKRADVARFSSLKLACEPRLATQESEFTTDN